MDESRSFSAQRYLKDKSTSNSCPRVGRIEWLPANPANLYTVPFVNSLTPDFERNCSVHERCLGHFSYNSGRYGLPAFMLSSTPETADERTTINNDYMEGKKTAKEFLAILKKSVSKKTGIYRLGLNTMTPPTTVRGVSVCRQYQIDDFAEPVENTVTDPYVVMCPRHWLKHMRVPVSDIDKCDEMGINHKSRHHLAGADLNSPILGLISRPPCNDERSMQPARIMPYDGNCIMIPAWYCDPLHADFDGDELIINVYFNRNSKNEINKLIEAGMKDDFSIQNMTNLVANTRLPKCKDIMVYCTLSIDKYRSHKVPDKLVKHAGGKREEMNLCYDIFRGDVKIDFVEKSSLSLWNNVKSKMTVSEGATLSRQLSLHALMMSYTDQILGYIPDIGTGVSVSSIYSVQPLNGRELGFGAARLAAKLAAPITQVSLDKAKRDVPEVGNNMILSLFNYKYPARYWVLEKDENGANKVGVIDCTEGIMPPETDILASTDRVYISSQVPSNNQVRFISRTLAFICKQLRVSYTMDEIIPLATLVAVSLTHSAFMRDPLQCNLADVNQERYGIFLNVDFITRVITTNIYDADRMVEYSRVPATVSNPIIAMATGNYSRLVHHSLAPL